MAVMEMNPASPAFRRIFSNPVAFAAFKATEPHLAGARAAHVRHAMHALRAAQLRCVALVLRGVESVALCCAGVALVLRWCGAGVAPCCAGVCAALLALRCVARVARARRPRGSACVTLLVTLSPQNTHRHFRPAPFPPKEYVSLDLAAAYTDAGFDAPGQLESTPRHRTVVGVKPKAAA